jgi:hypothetical protein
MFQKFNSKTQRYVKFKETKNGAEIVDVKQKLPKVPFKGVRVKK